MGKPYSEPSRGVIAEIELLIEKSIRMLAEGLRAESLTVHARKDDAALIISYDGQEVTFRTEHADWQLDTYDPITPPRVT
jgi:hypothetical protein